MATCLFIDTGSRNLYYIIFFWYLYMIFFYIKGNIHTNIDYYLIQGCLIAKYLLIKYYS